MQPTRAMKNRFPRRGGFTLVELLVVIAIIGILSSLFLGAMFASEENARVQKTKGTIAKINNIIMSRWEGYRTRRVPITIVTTSGVSPVYAAGWRLDALRELMRMEMPNTWAEVTTGPNAASAYDSRPAISRPSLSSSFLRKASTGSPTVPYETAETLYMLCTTGTGDEVDPRDLFKPDEIKDTDGDGFPEFVDAWGTPIIFIRWAPGFTSELQTHLDADPFDPLHIYPSVDGATGQSAYPTAKSQTNPTFALYPLIVSAGPDLQYDIVVPSGSPTNSDPFFSMSNPPAYGTLQDTNGNGALEYFDNIHNHLMGTK